MKLNKSNIDENILFNNYLILFIILFNISILSFIMTKYIFISNIYEILILICLTIILISLTMIKKQIIYFCTLINVILLCLVTGFNTYYFNSSTNYGFKKYSKNPVLGNTNTGSFFDPHVIEINDEYIMYFSYRSHGNITATKSKDGINWSEPITVLDKDLSTHWENIINRASVIYKDNKYMMWYTGQTSTNSAIGYAQSDDGIHFKRKTNTPIIEPQLNYEKNSVMNPHVIYDDDDEIFKMWYAAGEQYEPDVICYATSKDGIEWTKHSSNPVLTKSDDSSKYDSFKVGAVDVHKLDKNKYLMFYIGYTDINTARIMYALSNDGITWQKADKYVIQGTKFSFDKEAVYKPSALYNKKEQKWYIWYNGRIHNSEFIGLAYNNKYNFFEN